MQPTAQDLIIDCRPATSLCKGSSRVLRVCNGLPDWHQGIATLAVDKAAGDGHLRLLSPAPRLDLPRLDPVWAPVINRWRTAGLTVVQHNDLAPWRWGKAILNASLGPLCLATGQDMRSIWASPNRSLVRSAVTEGAQIAQRSGVHLPASFARRAFRFFAGVGPHRPTCCAHPDEIETYLDPLLQTADRYAIAAPALRRIFVSLSNQLAA